MQPLQQLMQRTARSAHLLQQILAPPPLPPPSLTTDADDINMGQRTTSGRASGRGRG